MILQTKLESGSLLNICTCAQQKRSNLRHLGILNERANIVLRVSVGNSDGKVIFDISNFEHIFGSANKPMESVEDLARLVEDLVRSVAALGCQNE